MQQLLHTFAYNIGSFCGFDLKHNRSDTAAGVWNHSYKGTCRIYV